MAILAVLAPLVARFVTDMHKSNIKLLVFAAMIALSACTLPAGTRKITAWGFWGVLAGVPVGVGYWSSEHGADTEGYNPAKPPVPAP